MRLPHSLVSHSSLSPDEKLRRCLVGRLSRDGSDERTMATTLAIKTIQHVPQRERPCLAHQLHMLVHDRECLCRRRCLRANQTVSNRPTFGNTCTQSIANACKWPGQCEPRAHGRLITSSLARVKSPNLVRRACRSGRCRREFQKRA